MYSATHLPLITSDMLGTCDIKEILRHLLTPHQT